VANALAVRFAHRRGDAIGKVTQALAHCHHPGVDRSPDVLLETRSAYCC
jgi:hypothetical protein